MCNKVESLFASIFVLLSFMSWSCSAIVASQCPSASIPVPVRGETVPQCSSDDEQRREALRSLNARIDITIDSLLPRIEEFLTPSPCSGPDWKRVVYIDLKNPNHTCPANSSWRLYTDNGKRLCRRSSDSGCDSATFDVDDVIGKYTKVCGRIVAYKFGVADAFGRFITSNLGLKDNYVDGISITHGNPLKHIWTFAAGSAESSQSHFKCPCEDGEPTLETISITNGHFFCESGGRDVQDSLIANNSLWDGMGCGPTSHCCSYNDPPYFMVTLSEPTCDNINVRLCGNSGEDTPIELIELYVK